MRREGCKGCFWDKKQKKHQPAWDAVITGALSVDVSRGLPLLGGRGFALRVPDGQTAEPGETGEKNKKVWRVTKLIETVQKTLREGLIELRKGRDDLKGINKSEINKRLMEQAKERGKERLKRERGDEKKAVDGKTHQAAKGLKAKHDRKEGRSR